MKNCGGLVRINVAVAGRVVGDADPYARHICFCRGRVFRPELFRRVNCNGLTCQTRYGRGGYYPPALRCAMLWLKLTSL